MTALFATPPSCVLLDLDNTLYAYAPCHDAGTRAVRTFAVQELNIAGADFDRCFEDARTELKRRLGHTASSHNRLLYFQRTLEKAGLATQSMATLQLEQAYWSAYLAEARLFPDVTEFLDDLRIAGIPGVIVTDLTAQIQHRKVIHLGLDRYIDWMVTSEEAGADKPDPRVFQLALAKLGGVEGAVWMIGDSPRCDIGGARDAIGALTLQKLHDGVERDGKHGPDRTFQQFSELRKLLARLQDQRAA